METQKHSKSEDTDLRNALALVVYYMRPEDSKLRRRYSSLIALYDKISGQDAEIKPLSIGVYGCPNKGKSTLLNSLLGENILPDAPIPSTSSIITLHRNSRLPEYGINCSGDHEKTVVHRKKPSEVQELLRKYGSHQGCESALKWDKIEVEGPFPDADKKLNPNFVLRDTPGAEAYADRVKGEELKQDSERTYNSIGSADLHLFCVSCEDIGGESDRAFYNRFFSERACIHVLTKRDKRGDDDTKIKDDYMNKMGLTDNEEAIMQIVLTGIQPDGESGTRDRFINIGREDLIDSICECLDPQFLIDKMRQIARFIVKNYDSDETMDDLKKIPKIHIRNLETATEK